MDVSAVCNSRIHYPHRTWDARKFKEREDGEMVAGRVKPVDPETAKVVPVSEHQRNKRVRQLSQVRGKSVKDSVKDLIKKIYKCMYYAYKGSAAMRLISSFVCRLTKMDVNFFLLQS
jgi:hypothetical protein